MPAEFYYNDNGTWRKIVQPYYNDNGTWRTLKNIYRNDGGTWREVYTQFSIVNPMTFTGEPYVCDATGEGFGASASQTLTIQTDGTWNVDYTGSFAVGETASGNWGTPAVSGIGSNYWVRFTRTAFSGTGTATASTGWLQLSSARSVSVISNAPTGFQSANATYTIEIATDSGGSNIVTSATGVDFQTSATA
jgi:hypothetical protein